MSKLTEFTTLLKNENGFATRIPVIGWFVKRSKQKAMVNFFNSLTEEDWKDSDLSKIFSAEYPLFINIFLRKGIRVDVVNRVAPKFYNYYFDDRNYLTKLKKLLKLQSGETTIPLALHRAMDYGDMELVKILLSKNKFNDINDEDYFGNTPLSLAVINGNIEIGKLLVKNGASLDFSRTDNKIINRAIVNKKDEMLGYLLENGNNLKEKDIFSVAAYQGGKFIRKIKAFNRLSEEKIKKIHDIGCAYFYLGLSYSISDFGLASYVANMVICNEINNLAPDFEHRNKLIEVAKIIAEKGEFIDRDGRKNKIIKASYKEHAAYFIVKYNKEGKPCEISYCDGAFPNDQNNGVITFQVDENKLFTIGDVETYLGRMQNSEIAMWHQALAQIVVCDEKNQPKIISTSIPTKPQKRGNCTLKSFNIVLREILSKKYGMDFTSPDSDGSKVYKKYRKNLKDKNLKIFFDLLDSEEEIFPQSEKALLEAVKIIFLKSVAKKDEEVESKIEEFLLRKNINPLEVEDKEGNNILFFAVQNGNVAVVEKVIQMGADVNWMTKKGFTPLYEAARSGEINIVKKLLENGADIGAKTKSGFTALHGALFTDNNEIAKILIPRMLELGLDLGPQFQVAARRGNKEIIEEMMKHKVGTAEAVKDATNAGHIELAKEIAEYEKKLPGQEIQAASAVELMTGNKGLEIVAGA